MHILVDMDGVLAKFEPRLVSIWQQRYPAELLIPYEQRRRWDIIEDNPADYRDRLLEIFTAVGYYRTLDVVEGSQAALAELKQQGHHVTICTAPMPGIGSSLMEKHDWVIEHFGATLAKNMITTVDKTMIKGDILIDNKPEIKGFYKKPHWEHIVYDHPYNRHITGQRRITWDNWKEILPEAV